MLCLCSFVTKGTESWPLKQFNATIATGPCADFRCRRSIFRTLFPVKINYPSGHCPRPSTWTFRGHQATTVGVRAGVNTAAGTKAARRTVAR